MSRRKHVRGFNRRTTPKNGARAMANMDGERVEVTWCAKHERFERAARQSGG